VKGVERRGSESGKAQIKEGSGLSGRAIRGTESGTVSGRVRKRKRHNLRTRKSKWKRRKRKRKKKKRTPQSQDDKEQAEDKEKEKQFLKILIR
jgi:hypothetical protein